MIAFLVGHVFRWEGWCFRSYGGHWVVVLMFEGLSGAFAGCSGVICKSCNVCR